jgi:hypothetical protein
MNSYELFSNSVSLRLNLHRNLSYDPRIQFLLIRVHTDKITLRPGLPVFWLEILFTIGLKDQATGFVLFGPSSIGNIQWGHDRDYLCLTFSSPFFLSFASPHFFPNWCRAFQSPCFKLFILIKSLLFHSVFLHSSYTIHHPTFLGIMDCLSNYLALHPDFTQETLEFLCHPDTNSTQNPSTEIHFSFPQPTNQIIQIAPKRFTGNSDPQ